MLEVLKELEGKGGKCFKIIFNVSLTLINLSKSILLLIRFFFKLWKETNKLLFL